jgi:hypothetical protein
MGQPHFPTTYKSLCVSVSAKLSAFDEDHWLPRCCLGNDRCRERRFPRDLGIAPLVPPRHILSRCNSRRTHLLLHASPRQWHSQLYARKPSACPVSDSNAAITELTWMTKWLLSLLSGASFCTKMLLHKIRSRSFWRENEESLTVHNRLKWPASDVVPHCFLYRRCCLYVLWLPTERESLPLTPLYNPSS